MAKPLGPCLTHIDECHGFSNLTIMCMCIQSNACAQAGCELCLTAKQDVASRACNDPQSVGPGQAYLGTRLAYLDFVAICSAVSSTVCS